MFIRGYKEGPREARMWPEMKKRNKWHETFKTDDWMNMDEHELSSLFFFLPIIVGGCGEEGGVCHFI